jgi:hypothetical protein
LGAQVVKINADLLHFHSIPSALESSIGGVDLVGSRVAAHGSWMNFYNHCRPHQAMNNQFPMAAWRAGMDVIEAAKTVDMPLRLDNANALPTYPQQTQTQQQEAA